MRVIKGLFFSLMSGIGSSINTRRVMAWLHRSNNFERICKRYAIASKGRGILPTLYSMHTLAQKLMVQIVPHVSNGFLSVQNKVFEEALAMYDKDTPDRWQKVAQAVGGGKTVDDVKMQYKELIKDVKEMDTAGLQNFQYGSSSNTSMGGSNSNGQLRG